MKRIIAITGPSGVGKTTLGNNLNNTLGIIYPQHCTTRDKRADDIDGFYKYLSHDEYNEFHKNGMFLISSGDHQIIKKGNGNFYGVLKDDCDRLFETEEDIILFVSYRDILNLIAIRDELKLYDVKIINLKYYDIGVMNARLVDRNTNNKMQIEKRIECAILLEKEYGDITRKYTDIIYTDKFSEKETLETAIQLIKKR